MKLQTSYLFIILILLVTLYIVISPSFTAQAEDKPCKPVPTLYYLPPCPTPSVVIPTETPSVSETPTPIVTIDPTIEPTIASSATPTVAPVTTRQNVTTPTPLLTATPTVSVTPTSLPVTTAAPTATQTQTTQTTQATQSNITPTPVQQVLGETKGGQPIYSVSKPVNTPQTGAGALSLLMLIPTSLAGFLLRKKI